MFGLKRKTGKSEMGRKLKKPDYDAEKLQTEMIDICKKLCSGEDINKHGSSSMSLRRAANELGISVSKVVKLLITGGYYNSGICRKINELYEEGKTVPEIQEMLEVSRATVQSYLPYKKGIYNAKDLSLNAERIRVYRERCRCIEELLEKKNEVALWNSVVLFQSYPFNTATGLSFSYVLKKGCDGTFNKELIVSRRKESKTLAWSSVTLAFDKALEMKGQVVERPKALGDIRGISYIYPMLYRFGIIEVPEETEKKMQVRGRRERKIG